MQRTTIKPRKLTTKAPRRNRELALLRSRTVVAGMDEVGRGAWAGPLVMAAVILPEHCDVPEIRDSKLLSPARREVVAKAIHESAQVGIGVVSVEDLNKKGLAVVLKLAAKRALKDLPVRPSHVLLDGNTDLIGDGYIVRNVVGGDRSEQCIAAASVVAKVYRDALMVTLAEKHPGYGFEWNKGYGTEKHREALQEFGTTAAHRTTWKPIIDLLKVSLPAKA